MSITQPNIVSEVYCIYGNRNINVTLARAGKNNSAQKSSKKELHSDHNSNNTYRGTLAQQLFGSSTIFQLPSVCL